MRIWFLLIGALPSLMCFARHDVEAMKKLQEAAEYSLSTNFSAVMVFPTGGAADLSDKAKVYRRVEDNQKASYRVELQLTDKSAAPGKKLVYIWGKFGMYAISPVHAIKLVGQMEKDAQLPNLVNDFYYPFMEASSYDFSFGRESVMHDGVECCEIRMYLKPEMAQQNNTSNKRMISFLIGKAQPFIYLVNSYDQNGAKLDSQYLQANFADVSFDREMGDALFIPDPDISVVEASSVEKYTALLQEMPQSSTTTTSGWIQGFLHSISNALWSNINVISFAFAGLGIILLLFAGYSRIKRKS